MNLSPKRLIRILEENGFYRKRMGKGSHHIDCNPDPKIMVPVPVHGKGTFPGVLKDAGSDTSALD